MIEERQYLESLRQTHQRRLRELEKKAAVLGISTAPELLIEAEDIRANISHIDRQLSPLTWRTVPATVPDFTGRDNEIDRLVNELSHTMHCGKAAALGGIRGMGGIGKTQLALAVAHKLASNFSDGQILLDMRGSTATPLPITAAIKTIISPRITSVSLPDDVLQLQLIYQATLDGKQLFILADDARDGAHVRPLLPPPGCALLTTSRQRFSLPGMVVLDLETMPIGEANGLLLTICPRIAEYAPQLSKVCGYLPLALRVSASVLANDDTQSIESYLDRLGNIHTKLAALRDPDDPSLNVEASLLMSYNALDHSAQEALCQLSILPGGFDLATAAAVLGTQTTVETEEVLGSLRRRCLLNWDAAAARYSLHDLMRAFAATRLSVEVPGYSPPVSAAIGNRVAQLAAQRRRLRYRIQQQEQLGEYAPSEVVVDIEDARSTIRDLKATLRSSGITIPNELIDDARASAEFDMPRAISEQDNRHEMIMRVKTWWVEGVLQKYSDICVDLAYEPYALARAVDDIMEQDSHTRATSRNSLLDVFDRKGGQLLILGEPGSGKTMSLLTLARDLIIRAEQKEQHPIPVIFNLSAWTHCQSIATWLIQQLNIRYFVPRRIAGIWTETAQLLPLLDGLDEVTPESRTACVQAINDFCRVGQKSLVVCSRVAEYEELSVKLMLSGAIVLQPLTMRQRNDVIARSEGQAGALRDVIEEDAELRELASSPLMLKIMILAYREMTKTSARKCGKKVRMGIMGAYVDAMFRRPKMDKPYTREQAMRGLSWLARTMIRDRLTRVGLKQLPRIQRFAAWRNGDLPWNIERFLDYGVELAVLTKFSGKYMFVHRLLMEYFAEQASGEIGSK